MLKYSDSAIDVCLVNEAETEKNQKKVDDNFDNLTRRRNDSFIG